MLRLRTIPSLYSTCNFLPIAVEYGKTKGGCPMRKFRGLWPLAVLLCLLAVALFWPREALSGWERPKELPWSWARTVQREILQAAEIAGGLDSVEERERLLAEAGFAVVDTDPDYPSYLANPDGLSAFWEAASAGKDTGTTVFKVMEDGTLHHLLFLRHKGEDLFFSTEVVWDADGNSCIQEVTVLPIYDMELADWGIFYYRLSPAGDPHYVDYNQLRMAPADREAYDLTRTYILPVEYLLVNLFLCDWQEGNWGQLSFHDLLGPLYELETGQWLNWTGFPFQGSPLRARVPAELFEGAILPYFRISTEEFRALCQYDETTDTYPWRPIYGNDLTTWEYPVCEPEVVDWTENSDGTLTLAVQVYSSDLKTDRLFCHETTVRPLENGRFQYVSNRITYVSDRGLPPSMPRFALDS